MIVGWTGVKTVLSGPRPTDCPLRFVDLVIIHESLILMERLVL